MPSGPARTFTHMPLCFIEPQDAIRVIAESLGRDVRAAGLRIGARRERSVLPGRALVVAAWMLERDV